MSSDNSASPASLVGAVAGGQAGGVFTPLPPALVDQAPEPRTPTSADVVIESPLSRAPAVLPVAPAWTSDVELVGGQREGFVVRGASVRGTSHRGNAVVRQDAFCVGFHDGSDAVVLAVADGVSAGTRSEVGAFRYAREAVAMAAAILDHDPGATPESLAGQLVEVASRGDYLCRREFSDLSPQQFAATLALAVVDHRSARLVLVGDAALWLLHADGSWTPALGGGIDVLRDNRTAAMPFHAECAVTATVTLAPGDVIVAMTDGLGDPLATGDSPTGDYLAGRWLTPPDLFRFGIDLSFEASSYQDDRTAVAVWRRRP